MTHAFTRLTRALLAISVLLVLSVIGAGTARAAAPSCRASADRTELLGKVASEPVRANPANTPCTTQSSETLSPTTVDQTNADAAEAYTHADVGSVSAIAGESKPKSLLGSVALGAQSVQSTATATCHGDTPVLSGSSRVQGLQINGQSVAVTPNDESRTIDLPGGGTVVVNEKIVSGGEVIQRAVDETIPGGGRYILAESRAGIDAGSCAGAGGGGSGGGSLSPCPAGSAFAPASGVCVIHTPGTDGHSASSTTVGRPYTGPSGGTVIALSTARKRFKSPCLSGGGAKYVTIGTAKANRITGSNSGDRILTLGGNDTVEGGRGNDCIDGGSGNDVIAGGIGNDQLHGNTGNDRVGGNTGNDRIWGGPGNDTLDGGNGNDRFQGNSGRDRITGDAGNDTVHAGTGNDRVLGGPGNDRLYGDSGNDYLSGGYGADRLYGGAGNDFLDASALGKVAIMIDGGAGRDRARYNPSEKRHVRHVERSQIVTLRR